MTDIAVSEIKSRPSLVVRLSSKVGIMDGTSASRDRFMFALLTLVFVMPGFFYGFSPLVLPVSLAFDEHGSESYTGGVFLYGFGVLFLTLNVMAVVLIDKLARRPELRMLVVTSAIGVWPFSLAFLAAMVHVRSFIGLMFGFVAMAYTLSVVGQWMLHTMLPLWYGDEITKGSSACGFAIGGGAVSWTVFLGEITNAMGAENVVLVILVAALASAVPAYLVLAFCNPASHLPPTQKGHAPTPKDKVAPTPTPDLSEDKAASQVAAADSQVAATENGGVQSKKTWWRFYVSDQRIKLFCYSITAMFFCGNAMKLLLSTIFEEALQLSYVEATRLAAICLLMYLPGRGLTPLYCKKERVFTVYITVLIFETFAYGLTPWAISLNTRGDRQLALGVYTILRLISGGGFAVMLGNIGVLLVRVFNKDEIENCVACLSATQWISGIGPSIAWAIHVEARKESSSEEEASHSFDAFFFLCAAVAFSAAVSVALLQRGARNQPKSEDTAGPAHC